jgi:hypothetical protein
MFGATIKFKWLRVMLPPAWHAFKFRLWPQVGCLRFRISGQVVLFGIVILPLAALLRPGEVRNGDDEETRRKVVLVEPTIRIEGGLNRQQPVDIPVRSIGNTSQSIIPSQQRSHHTKDTTRDGELRVHLALRTLLDEGDGETEKGQVQREEKREERHCRLQRADEQNRGEDEPALK